MQQYAALRPARVPLALLALFLSVGSALPAAVRTNWVDRWVTNNIDVYVPANRYVTEFRTNLVVHAVTNVVDVYSTNLVTKVRTNHIQIDLVRTNFVQAYRTNYKQLALTNWTTLLVLQTNWVQQTVTNVAVVEMPRTESAKADRDPAVFPAPVTPSVAANPVTIEASRGSKQGPKNQLDVRLNLRWATPGQSSAQACKWKVQSDDGSVLCYGQELEFRRSLPFGTYKVEASVQPGLNGKALTVSGTLSVNSREARLLEQRMLARR